MANITRSIYKDLSYESYKTQAIDSIEVRNSDNTVRKSATGDNKYVLKGNFLTAGMTDADLNTATSNLFNAIKDITYTPSDSNTKGNPCIEVGDPVTYLTDEDIHINSFVMQRTLKGIQALNDEYINEGNEYLDFAESNTKQDMGNVYSTLGSYNTRITALEKGGGGGNANIKSVATLPTNPDYNTVYLIQGEVVVR